MILRHALLPAVFLFFGCCSRNAGWHVEGALQYNRENLYDYIDGGAEYYLKRGFQGLTVQRYVLGAGGPATTVELYDMGTGQQAWDIYSESVSGDMEPLNAGKAGAIYGRSGYAEFCQDSMYVRIIAYDLASSAQSSGIQRLAELARLVSSKLSRSTGE